MNFHYCGNVLMGAIRDRELIVELGICDDTRQIPVYLITMPNPDNSPLMPDSETVKPFTLLSTGLIL